MSRFRESFDPYFTWLGIPPAEQPANYYRLLGLKLFEGDPVIIENAADRQMSFVRSFQLGPHRRDVQRVLNEVSAARVTLLTPQRKSEYDAELRTHQELLAPSALPLPVAPGSFSANAPPPMSPYVAVNAPLAMPAPVPPPASPPPTAPPPPPPETQTPIAGLRPRRRPRQTRSTNYLIPILGILLFVVSIAVIIYAISPKTPKHPSHPSHPPSGTKAGHGKEHPPEKHGAHTTLGSHERVVRASAVSEQIEPAVAETPSKEVKRSIEHTPTPGGKDGGHFEDRGEKDSLLAGFEYTTGNFAPGVKIIKSIRPLYWSSDGQVVPGKKSYGHPNGEVHKTQIEPGYAVAAIVVKTGMRVDGFQVILAKIGEHSLDSQLQRATPWYGGRGGSKETTLGVIGQPVVGVHGRKENELHAIGLIQLGKPES